MSQKDGDQSRRDFFKLAAAVGVGAAATTRTRGKQRDASGLTSSANGSHARATRSGAASHNPNAVSASSKNNLIFIGILLM